MEFKLMRSFGVTPKHSSIHVPSMDIYMKFGNEKSKIIIRQNGIMLRTRAHNEDLRVFAEQILEDLRKQKFYVGK